MCGYILVSLTYIKNSPRRIQIVVLGITFFIIIGYCLLVFLALDHLRSTYLAIDPKATIPALNTPSTSDIAISDWQILQSPFNRTKNSAFEDPPTRPPDDTHTGGMDLPTWARSPVYSVDALMDTYLQAEANFLVQFNALVLFCVLAAGSSGMRYGTYILYQCITICCLIVAATYTSIVSGFDGQRMRLVLVTVASLLGGTWIARPLESEMRKWIHMKSNYQL